MSPELSRPSYQPIVERVRIERARELRRLLGRGTRAVAGGVEAAVAALRRWHERRATQRVLQALDDRTLKDIGLYRGDIWSTADEIARGRLPAGRPGPKATPVPDVVTLPAPPADTAERRRAA